MEDHRGIKSHPEPIKQPQNDCKHRDAKKAPNTESLRDPPNLELSTEHLFINCAPNTKLVRVPTKVSGPHPIPPVREETKMEPIKTEPSKMEPSKTEPSKTELAGVSPSPLPLEGLGVSVVRVCGARGHPEGHGRGAHLEGTN